MSDPKKASPWYMSRRWPPMFFPRSFMVSGDTFKPLIGFELFFVYSVKVWVAQFHSSACGCHSHTTPFIEQSTFYPLFVLGSCHRLIDSICMGLFLAFLFHWSWLTNPTSIHEDTGSIPSPSWWVKDLVLPQGCSLGHRHGFDLVLPCAVV